MVKAKRNVTTEVYINDKRIKIVEAKKRLKSFSKIHNMLKKHVPNGKHIIQSIPLGNYTTMYIRVKSLNY